MHQPRTIQDYRQLEAQVFPTIPGFLEILDAPESEKEAMNAKYPDAAFVFHIAGSLFHHNRALSLITQRAYFSILRGDCICDVRLRYDKELTEYWNRHLWDD